MKKIAPTLQRYVDGFPDGAVYDAARAELRALLAVARAANKAWYEAERPSQAVLRLAAALSRLDKVSHD